MEASCQRRRRIVREWGWDRTAGRAKRCPKASRNPRGTVLRKVKAGAEAPDSAAEETGWEAAKVTGSAAAVGWGLAAAKAGGRSQQ